MNSQRQVTVLITRLSNLPPPTSVNGGDMTLSSENSRYQSRFNENAAFPHFDDTSFALVMTQRDQPTITHSTPYTNSPMDWAELAVFVDYNL